MGIPKFGIQSTRVENKFGAFNNYTGGAGSGKAAGKGITARQFNELNAQLKKIAERQGELNESFDRIAGSFDSISGCKKVTLV